MDILSVFGHHTSDVKIDVKIDVNMCEPHCVNLFFANLLYSPDVSLLISF